jgi:predicted MPP superfamily phosphohydrolase
MPRALVRVLFAVVPLILFVPPWALLVMFGPSWPTPVVIVGTLLFAGLAATLPLLLSANRRREPGLGSDRLARAAEMLLGSGWVLFTWTLLAQVLRPVLGLAGVEDPNRSRIVAAGALVVTFGVLLYGYLEAMRVPRVKWVDVVLPRLGADLDGLRLVQITDTHFGPINRARWASRVVDQVNALEPDLVCHTGDLADGTVAERAEQVQPLSRVRASLGRFYVSGNHEYYGPAQDWMDHMAKLDWRVLHNEHEIVQRGADRLVVAGVDDATAAGYQLLGHGADLAAALADTDPELPVLLLAHQPKQVLDAVVARVDLQISGHTHGGQVWPFHYLVRTDQPVLAGLRLFSERTWLYTSRGTGFWGPPLRVFAPSEITVLVLRRAEATGR